ncbi:TPA: hypothetical protein MYQ00_000690 [Citrobacter braakii]|nr:hypothetical protein [Citrobacter braakii]HCB1684873.1 hypothetical protein [Citrobacter braakii]HCB1700791.1 hypothetical protein [Citrobacter braakii]HCB1717422.1 hypothetical protein [Citrobacter braakii]HCB1805734.1 hypothetical protein [Citrobacter braakii]
MKWLVAAVLAAVRRKTALGSHQGQVAEILAVMCDFSLIYLQYRQLIAR